MAQFQASKFEKKEILKLLRTINSELGENSLESSVLANVFEKWWPDLNSKMTEQLAVKSNSGLSKIRSDREIIEEILSLLRNISKISTYGNRAEAEDMILNLETYTYILSEFANVVESIASCNIGDKRLINAINGIGTVLVTAADKVDDIELVRILLIDLSNKLPVALKENDEMAC